MSLCARQAAEFRADDVRGDTSTEAASHGEGATAC